MQRTVVQNAFFALARSFMPVHACFTCMHFCLLADTAGFGYSFRTPMRVASVSKPMTYAAFMYSRFLRDRMDLSFYGLWVSKIGSLPQPRDPRVMSITIRHLLDHLS